MAGGRRGTRGSALVIVLFVLLLCEVALLMAALQIHLAASRYLYERERLNADWLAESGLAHAEAALLADGSFRGGLEGKLMSGHYKTTVEADGETNDVLVTSTGFAAERHAVRLVVRLRRGGKGAPSIVDRERTHFLVTSPPGVPPLARP